MKKIGILGGGQLGRMLLQAAANYPVEMHVLEKDSSCPAAAFCGYFHLGDIKNYDDVFQFGKGLDAITIEIENVNVEALEALEKEGVSVIPSPAALRIIKNKKLQKEFYIDQEIPTTPFHITTSRADLQNFIDFLPAVHKLAEGGYDGKGVQIFNEQADLENGFDSLSVLEKKVDIKKELAIMVAVSTSGETAIYKPVDMIFDPYLNLLSHQVSPADIPDKIFWKAEAIALKLVKNLKSPGLFAVELFTDKEDYVWVNETAPRVHNSGHHTIEACYSSQFDMLMRILLDYPLGNTEPRCSAALVNLIGEENADGMALYENLKDVLSMDNVFVHIYGKQESRGGRKMGHVTILSNEKQELVHKVNGIKNILKVVGLSATENNQICKFKSELSWAVKAICR